MLWVQERQRRGHATWPTMASHVLGVQLARAPNRKGSLASHHKPPDLSLILPAPLLTHSHGNDDADYSTRQCDGSGDALGDDNLGEPIAAEMVDDDDIIVAEIMPVDANDGAGPVDVGAGPSRPINAAVQWLLLRGVEINNLPAAGATPAFGQLPTRLWPEPSRAKVLLEVA